MNRQLDTGNKIDKNERKTFTVRLFYLCEGFYHLYALGAKHSNILSSCLNIAVQQDDVLKI